MFGRLGNDVDNSINGIGPPQGSSRSPNDFNAFNIFKNQIKVVPPDS